VRVDDDVRKVGRVDERGAFVGGHPLELEQRLDDDPA